MYSYFFFILHDNKIQINVFHRDENGMSVLKKILLIHQLYFSTMNL